MATFPFAPQIGTIGSKRPSVAVLWPELPPTGDTLSNQQESTERGQALLLVDVEPQTTAGFLQAKGLSEQRPFSGIGIDRFKQTFSVLSGFYTISNPMEVQSFLNSRKNLVKLLYAALPKIKQSWGDDVKTSLELLTDPEDDSSSVVVRIQSNLPHPYDALDNFDRNWWLAEVGHSDGLLNFSVEPK